MSRPPGPIRPSVRRVVGDAGIPGGTPGNDGTPAASRCISLDCGAGGVAVPAPVAEVPVCSPHRVTAPAPATTPAANAAVKTVPRALLPICHVLPWRHILTVLANTR